MGSSHGHQLNPRFYFRPTRDLYGRASEVGTACQQVFLKLTAFQRYAFAYRLARQVCRDARACELIMPVLTRLPLLFPTFALVI